MQFYKLLSLVGLAFLLLGCTYGYGIDSQVTRVNMSYPRTHSVHMMFGRYPERNYQQIAYIRVTGEERSDTTDLLMEMEKEAKGLGADAVVGITRTTVQRRAGSGFIDALELISAINDPTTRKVDKEDEEYTAPLLEGVAVKYINETE